MEKCEIKQWAKANLKNWLAEKDIKSLFNNDDLVSCINNCTSPRANGEHKQINEEDLKLIFKAFSLFEPQKTRVLILGQDPYPEVKRAQGLAFSFKNNQKPADDSLLNIFKAIEEYKKKNNINITKSIKEWDTNLECWAKNNDILLLNTALTYCYEIKKEDRVTIWNPFVKKIIENLLVQNENELVVFLWGDDAKLLFHKTIFDDKNNIKDITGEIKRNLLVLSTSHPSNNFSAFKRGFCYEAPNHFKACDEFLGKNIWKNFPENNQEKYYNK